MSDIHSQPYGNPSALSPDALRLRLREGMDKHRRRLRLSAIAIVGILAVGSFVAQHLASPATKPTVTPLPKAATAESSVELPSAATKATSSKAVVVQIVGAVNSPGVIEVPGDARVNDVVAKAGGPTADADLSRVNLAAKVVDGAQISVPVIGQPVTAAVSPVSPSGAASKSSGPVNINTASVDELDALPGVGPALAAAIVAQRDKLGSFKSVSELNDVKGIGDSKFADIKDLVTV